ncbi:MAG: HAMP domain-containing histidine kinase, partial [Calditrichaeota bacterium]|nr:HAMP domain-containing histidine kinase [Calditrichota bacterium]
NDVSARIATKLLNSLKSDSAMINLEKELQKSLGILQQSSRNNARAAERIVGIIRSLKNFSRLDEADFQEADIHEGLESTLTLISHEIKDKITVEKDYGELPRLYLYVNEINQVFMNLLLNAVQASYDGGKIRLKTFRENGQICVRIADTGKGIPREKLENLFEPGFSTDSARVKMRTGLYTSYSIIQKHKGDIQVESEVGKGTAFTICLPVNLNDHSKRGA